MKGNQKCAVRKNRKSTSKNEKRWICRVRCIRISLKLEEERLKIFFAFEKR